MSKTALPTNYDPRVTHLDVDFTNDCMLACDYCFRGEKEKKALGYETGTRAIDFLMEHSGGLLTLTMSLFGGEPLLAFDMIRRLRRYAERKSAYYGKAFGFSATTNMVAANDRIIDFFKRHRIGFHTSIDGTPESHDHHRRFPDGRPSSPHAFRRIPDVLEYAAGTVARATVCNDTAHRMFDDMIYLVEKLGYRHVALIPVYEQDWTEEQFKLAERELRKISDYYIEQFRANRRVHIKHMFDGINNIVNLSCRKTHCGAGRRALAVSVEGDLYPCHRFPKAAGHNRWRLGNVWDGIDHEKRRVLEGLDCQRDKQADCENCIAVHGCGIGCIAVNWMTYGNIYKVHENNCRFTRIYFKEAMRVHYILLRERNELFLNLFYDGDETQRSSGDLRQTKEGEEGATPARLDEKPARPLMRCAMPV